MYGGRIAGSCRAGTKWRTSSQIVLFVGVPTFLEVLRNVLEFTCGELFILREVPTPPPLPHHLSFYLFLGKGLRHMLRWCLNLVYFSTGSYCGVLLEWPLGALLCRIPMAGAV